MSFLRPILPADALRLERERVARKRSHLWVVQKDPAEVEHDPEMFTWRDPAELWERDQ